MRRRAASYFRPAMKTSALLLETTRPTPSAGDNNGASLNVVRRAQAGDVDAFEALYREHSPRIYALCLRLMGGNRIEATDLMQDAFIRAWRRLSTFRGECAFASWLHRLVVNAMLENARGARRRDAKVLSIDDTSSLPGAARGSGIELKMDMDEAIASLPKGARVAFLNHHF
jgi:RNA polymerase sigma-70 factor (ECF subfamily)